MNGKQVAKTVMPIAAAVAVGSWVYLWFRGGS